MFSCFRGGRFFEITFTVITPQRLYFIADFNVEMLARLVANTVLPGAEVATAPFGQVMPALAAAPPGPDWAAVVWSQPESVVDTFRRALAFEPAVADQAVAETKAYAAALARFAGGARAVFVPTWTRPPWQRGYGMLDFRPGIGIAHMLARMNLALAEALHDQTSVFLLDAERWMASIGPHGWSPKLWYATKSRFAPAVLEQAAWDIGAALAGLDGATRRLVIVDLDDVLWGGVVGETGWQALNLGGHDHIGEAFADFQRALKALTRRGVQIAIVSKNEESTALEAIEHHPEMQLRRGDFAGWRINWGDKGQNVIELLADLGLGPESAVFVDDSAIERARVQAAVPGVLVPDWPVDPTRYVEALMSLRCFDSPFLTAEDRARTDMYAAERTRRTERATALSLDEWLESLGTSITVESLLDGNLDRTVQLLNKTNQMNLATRRLSPSELQQWASMPGHRLLTLRVADRFGDSGLTGLVGLSIEGTCARLVDFLLSCRVMGRNVEDAMLHAAIAHSRAHGASQLVAEFRPTPRNGPCLEFLRRSRLRPVTDTVFVWDTADPYPRPRWVALHDRAGVAAAVER
jgi:FkbH-like protein